MNPHSHSLVSIIDYFSFPEPLRTHILQNHPEGNFESEEELFTFIRKVGNEGDQTERAEELIFDLEERVNIIKHKLKFIDERQKPSVLVMSDVIPPVFETSHYLAHLIRVAGGKMYDAEIAEGKTFNPDVILLVSERMERMFGGLANLLTLEEWEQTNAVKNNRVFLIDGGSHLRGMDTNLASDIEILGEIFYPQYLTFSGKGESWLQFEL